MSDYNYELRFFEDNIYFRSGQTIELEPAIRMFFVLKGQVEINGVTLSENEGCFSPSECKFTVSDDVAELARWELVPSGEPIIDILTRFNESVTSYGQSLNKRTAFLNLQDNEVGIRLDTVTFPPGTCAYRHIHASEGIRYIVRGTLEINTDEGIDLMEQGHAWFEGENQPVLAIASEEVETMFARVMVLPKDYHGKLTITYVDPADDGKPRENKNNRLIDEVVTLN